MSECGLHGRAKPWKWRFTYRLFVVLDGNRSFGETLRDTRGHHGGRRVGDNDCTSWSKRWIKCRHRSQTRIAHFPGRLQPYVHANVREQRGSAHCAAAVAVGRISASVVAGDGARAFHCIGLWVRVRQSLRRGDRAKNTTNKRAFRSNVWLNLSRRSGFSGLKGWQISKQPLESL